MKKPLLTILVIPLLAVGILTGEGRAQNPPEVKSILALDKQVYTDTEPIMATLNIANVGAMDVITAKGFSSTDFPLFLVFTDPEGKVITANMLGSTSFTPPLPSVALVSGQLVQVEPVEILSGSSAWSQTYTFDARDYYTLVKNGEYAVRAVIPMRTYPAEDPPGSGFAPLGSFDWQDFIRSNVFKFTQLPSGTTPGIINVRVDKHTVGSGSYPGSSKEPLSGVTVMVFNKATPCVAQYGTSQYGFSWKNYQPIYDNCFNVASASGVTDNTGSVSFQLEPGEYLLIGKTPDELYIGSPADLESGETVNKYLQVIVKADGKKVPGKTTKITGSELLIIEPEYVEWDGTQELYPFIFESVGDWTVTTSVAPPEGFVADKTSLTEKVNNELEAVQFVITDVGSKWVPTDVKYVTKHKKKTKTIKSKVGVKLSKKLAKKKGVSIYGE